MPKIEALAKFQTVKFAPTGPSFYPNTEDMLPRQQLHLNFMAIEHELKMNLTRKRSAFHIISLKRKKKLCNQNIEVSHD